jgi:hypothetical protein
MMIKKEKESWLILLMIEPGRQQRAFFDTYHPRDRISHHAGLSFSWHYQAAGI